MEKFGGLSQQPKTFREQYEKRAFMETSGGAAEVVDISPREPKSEVPILFAPAWGCTLPVYEPLLEEIEKNGRRVISLNHPRRGGKIELSETEQPLMEGYPKAEVRKALTLRDVLDKKRLEKVDIIAHSEGAANAALAALMNPKRVRNIVFFAPAGLIGKDTALRLLQGFASQGNPKPTLEKLHVSEDAKAEARATGRTAIEYPEISPTEATKEVGARVMKEVGKYAAKNPMRAVEEWWGLSRIQIDDLVAKLREHGIGIVIMSGVDDPVFDTKTMAERLKKGSVDGFLAVRGGHGQIGDNPERYVIAALQMLDALAAKQGRTKKAGTSV